MAFTLKQFYVTLFSTASRDIYDQNIHANFTVKLAQPVDLGTTADWEVGVCEISCSTSQQVDTHALIYCKLIAPQFVGDSTVRCMWTFFVTDTACHREFQYVHYVPVEQRRFQDIRIEFLTSEGLHIPLDNSVTPTKVVHHFRKNYQW
jgi:hypothetical protein